MKRFDVEWDDFSGGYYVGNNDSKQPRNTWVGADIGVTPDKGFLVPLALPSMTGRATLTALAGATTNNFVVAPGTAGGAGLCVVSYGTNTYYSDGVGTAAWTTIAHGGTTALSIVDGIQPTVFQAKALMPTDTTKIILFDLSTPGVTTPTTPVSFARLGKYKEWAVGAAAGSNRLYYSAISDPSSWPSANYLDLGSSSAKINAIADMHDSLYVGTSEGWWAISGVLGETTTQRLVAAAEVAGGGAVLGGSILFIEDTSGGSTGTVEASGEWRRVAVLSGSTVRAITPAEGYMTAAYKWGHSAVLVGSTATLGNGILASGAHLGSGWSFRSGTAEPARLASYSVSSSVGYYLTTDGANTKIAAFDLYPTDPVSDAGAATVDLADYQHNSPFRVTEAIVELSLGTTSAAMTRSVALKLKAPLGPLDFAAGVVAMTGNETQTQTLTFPRMTSTAGERPVIRFNSNLTGDTYSVTPSITLQGCMLRRVILRCQEAT